MSGTTGGMGLSVGIGINLTGFAALNQIAADIQKLMDQANRTTMAFNRMGAAYAKAMAATGPAQAAINQMQQAAITPTAAPRAGNGGRAWGPDFGNLSSEEMMNARGINLNESSIRSHQKMLQREAERAADKQYKDDRGLAEYHEGDLKIIAANEARARKESERAIRQETRTREQAATEREKTLGGLKAGIMGGIGVTAAFEAANLARRGITAIGELDDRIASLRLGGISPGEIANLKSAAIHTYAPGANTADKISGAQQLGVIVGPQNVNSDMMKQVQIATNAIMRTTGRQDRGEVMQQFLRIVQARGPVTSENMLTTLQDIELVGKDVNLEALKNSAQQGQTFNRAFDINHNPQLRALTNTLDERFGGRGGLYLNEVFTEFYSNLNKIGGHEKGIQGLLLGQGKYDTSNMVAYPALSPSGGGKGALRMVGPALRGVDQQDPGAVFGTILKSIETDFVQHKGRMPTQLERQQEYGQFFRPEVARTLSVLTADDFIREYKSQLERQKLTPQTWTNQEKAALSFNQALTDVGKEFDSLATVMTDTGGITSSLESFAQTLHSFSGFLGDHPAIPQAATAIGETGLIAGAVATGAWGLKKLLGIKPMEAVEGAAEGSMRFMGAGGKALTGAASGTAEVLSAATGLAELAAAAYLANKAIEGFGSSIGDWLGRHLLGHTDDEQQKRDKMITDLNEKSSKEFWDGMGKLLDGFVWVMTGKKEQANHLQRERDFQNTPAANEPLGPPGPTTEAKPSAGLTHKALPNVPRGVAFGPGVMPMSGSATSIPPGMTAKDYYSHSPAWRMEHSPGAPGVPVTSIPGVTPTTVPVPGLSSGSLPTPIQPSQSKIDYKKFNLDSIETQTLIVKELIGNFGGGGGGSGRGSGSGPAGRTAPESVPGGAGSFLGNRFAGGEGGKSGIGSAQPTAPGATGSLAKTIGLSGGQYDAYRNSIAKIEHARYDQMGGVGGRYAGKYQMGPNEIKETAQHLGLPVPTQQQFLHDPSMQEKFFERYTLDHNATMMHDPKYAGLSPTQKAAALGYAHNQGAGGAMNWLDHGAVGRDAFGTAGTAYSDAVTKAMAGVPNVQGPQISPEQADVPASNMHVTINSQHMLDGDMMAETVANHFIGGGATATPSTSGYDTKMMPYAPGSPCSHVGDT